MKRDIREFQPDALPLERQPLPFPALLTLHVLCACVVSFLAWAAWAQVDRIVMAGGRLITTEPLIVVQPLETAVIRSINVAVGDVVSAGSVVATLDPTFTDADSSALRVRLASLDAQIRRLDAVTTNNALAFGDGMDQPVQAAILERQRYEYRSRVESYRQRAARIQANLNTVQ